MTAADRISKALVEGGKERGYRSPAGRFGPDDPGGHKQLVEVECADVIALCKTLKKSNLADKHNDKKGEHSQITRDLQMGSENAPTPTVCIYADDAFHLLDKVGYVPNANSPGEIE